MPLGTNPWFPEETETAPAQTQPASSDEETEATDQLASEPGEQEVVEAANQEPTFDLEEDRRRGIDVDDPNYKHFQAAFTKATQRHKKDAHVEADKLLERLEQIEGKQRKDEAEAEIGEPTDSPEAIRLNFDGFTVTDVPALPEGQELSGYEDQIARIAVPLVQQVAQYAVEDIQRQQMAFMQRMQAEQAKQQVTTFLSDVETQHPEKAREAIHMLKEYKDFARQTPEKWVTFARKVLDLDAAPEQAPEVSPAGNGSQRLAEKARSAVPKPTATRQVANQPPSFNSTRDAIEYAVDQALGR